ncbi:MAG: mobile mystery protein B [Bacteroidota bacterium]
MGLEFEYTNGQTPIDEVEKGGLKIKSISTLGELDAFEQQNIEEAIQWTLKNTFTIETVLSEKFINLVHKKMFGHVWRWAGNYRQTNKNIGVQFYMISQQLRVHIDNCLYWFEHNTFAPDEIAIRFKHGLVAIHLYPNGNGRHSRLMGDLLIEAFERRIFTWGSQTIRKERSRKMYISALKEADRGDFQKLIAFARQ